MLFEIKSEVASQSSVEIKELVALVEKGVFPFESKVKTHESEEWLSLNEVPAIETMLALKLLESSPSYNYESIFHHWCLKGLSGSESLTLLEVVKLYQKKDVGPDSLVRHPSLHGWVPLASQKPFDKPGLLVLHKISELRKVFAIRRNPRIAVKKKVRASKEGQSFEGICWSLSTQGLGFDTSEPTQLKVGDNIELILKDADQKKDSHFECEIVSVVQKATYDSVGVRFDDSDELSETDLDFFEKEESKNLKL